MTDKVPNEALEGLIQRAGLGARSAKKLRAANGDTSDNSSQRRPRGHGPATDNRRLGPAF